MSGPKIMVFQLKDLIKTGIFILVGLLIVIALVLMLIPKSGSEAKGIYNPGTYSAQIILHNNPVDVEVTVSEKAITDIQLKNMQEIQEVFYPLFKPTLENLSKQIVKHQTTKIAADPETEFTSKILLSAVEAALEQAVAKN